MVGNEQVGRDPFSYLPMMISFFRACASIRWRGSGAGIPADKVRPDHLKGEQVWPHREAFRLHRAGGRSQRIHI